MTLDREGVVNSELWIQSQEIQEFSVKIASVGPRQLMYDNSPGPKKRKQRCNSNVQYDLVRTVMSQCRTPLSSVDSKRIQYSGEFFKPVT